MTVTTTGLTKAAGIAAAASGLLYGSLQFVHPLETVAAVTTTRWAVVHYLTIAMAVLGVFGVTGMYLRQARRVGVLGLVGYLLFGAFYLVTMMFSFVEAFVLPEMAGQAPHLVAEINAIFGGGDTGDLGAIKATGAVGFALYLFAGLTFGIALFRARILSRWASALLAVGAVLPIAGPLVPHQVLRGAAVPVGIAMIGLGVSLWRDQRNASAAQTSASPAVVPAARVEPSTVR